MLESTLELVSDERRRQVVLSSTPAASAVMSRVLKCRLRRSVADDWRLEEEQHLVAPLTVEGGGRYCKGGRVTVLGMFDVKVAFPRRRVLTYS